MRRVLVIGCGGAGKSTLAVELGRLLDLPVIHLDRHFWRPGWVSVPTEEWEEIVRDLVAGERWVMDGNYGATLDMRLAAADTVIFMDFPTRLCLWRVLARWVRHRGRTRPDMGPECPETVDLEFLRWIVSFRRKSRPKILSAVQEHGEGVQVVVLRNPREVRAFLASVEVV